MADEEVGHDTADTKVKLAGQDVEPDQLHAFSVDLDLSQPDMCTLTLKNKEHKFSNQVKHGDAVEVKVGDDILFKGEVVSIEPIYKAGGESKCVVRAFNRLHRLLSGRKSRTFLDQSYQDIASAIASDAGLSANAGSSPNIKHKHVYQHNQDNLSFLRLLARRIGYEVWCEDRTLYFDVPKVDRDSGIELKTDGVEDPKLRLTSFHPRMSSAAMVKKVTVRGWDPEKKEEIVGEEEVSGSKLGSKTGFDASTSAFGQTMTFEVDTPIFSVDEAKAIAKSKLEELSMSYITGEGAPAAGNAKLKPGIVVKLTVNVDEASDRFNGKYLVVGVSHTYTHDKGGGGTKGGYRSAFRVRRDAEGSGAQGGEQPPPEEIQA